MKKLIAWVFAASLLLINCGGEENRDEIFTQTDNANWEPLPEMPTPRSEIDGVIYDGVIYVAGGFYNGSETSGAFEAYHIGEESWEILPDMPQPAHHPAITAAEGRVYVSGGWYNFGEDQQNLSTFWAYNIEDGEWTQKTDMPYTRGAHRKVYFNGSIYVISGAGPEPGDILRYNIQNDSWDILETKLELTRDHSAITLAGENIYLISGRGAGTEQPRVDLFNLNTYEFQRLADIPTPRGGHTAEYANGNVYVIGGEVGGDDPYALARVEIFDTEQGTWTSGYDLPYTVHGHASAHHNGTIFTIGGATGAFFETFETLTGNNYQFITGND
jgi:N-acetylneuraminic acid mutarotase